MPIAFFLVAIWLGGRTTEAGDGRSCPGPSRHHSKGGMIIVQIILVGLGRCVRPTILIS